MSQPANFETCFASGLDLSELSADTSATTNSARPSSNAASKLLKETQRKAEERRMNEGQEFALAQAIQGHVLASSSSSSSTKPRKQAHAALLHMHAVEQKDEPRQRLVKKGPKTWKKQKVRDTVKGKMGRRRGS